MAALHRFDVRVLWLVGFHCFLRSGEKFNVRARDVAFAADRTIAVLSLGFTKTGRRQGAQESVTASDAVVVRALWQLVQQRQPSEPLARFSGPRQWALFKQACRSPASRSMASLSTQLGEMGPRTMSATMGPWTGLSCAADGATAAPPVYALRRGWRC